MVFTVKAPYYDLGRTLKSGQVFRFIQLTRGSYKVYAGSQVCTMTQTSDWIQIDDTNENNEEFWKDYLGLDLNMYELNRLMTPNPILSRAFDFSSGIHLLHQDPFECLVSFIISQQKRIPQIQTAVEKLCRICGTEISDGVFAFPRPDQILNADLSAVRLGYREEYVRNAAEQVAKGNLDLDSLRKHRCSYEEAMSTLRRMYGVGEKVASCVALFGLGHTNAFPIDTHIQKVLTLPELQSFRPEDYGDYAGYVQQYLFNWALYNGY